MRTGIRDPKPFSLGRRLAPLGSAAPVPAARRSAGLKPSPWPLLARMQRQPHPRAPGPGAVEALRRGKSNPMALRSSFTCAAHSHARPARAPEGRCAGRKPTLRHCRAPRLCATRGRLNTGAAVGAFGRDKTDPRPATCSFAHAAPCVFVSLSVSGLGPCCPSQGTQPLSLSHHQSPVQIVRLDKASVISGPTTRP